FFFSSRRRHTRSKRDWSSDVCSSDLVPDLFPAVLNWANHSLFPILLLYMDCIVSHRIFRTYQDFLDKVHWHGRPFYLISQYPARIAEVRTHYDNSSFHCCRRVQYNKCRLLTERISQ